MQKMVWPHETNPHASISNVVTLFLSYVAKQYLASVGEKSVYQEDVSRDTFSQEILFYWTRYTVHPRIRCPPVMLRLCRLLCDFYIPTWIGVLLALPYMYLCKSGKVKYNIVIAKDQMMARLHDVPSKCTPVLSRYHIHGPDKN